MTPEGERIENTLRELHDDYDDWDAFSQIHAMTLQWLKERGELPPLREGSLFLESPTKAQMMACALYTMGDAMPVAGHA